MKNRILEVTKSEGFYNFRNNHLAMLGAVIIITFIMTVLVGPFLTPQNPYNPKELDLSNSYKPPAWDGGDARFVLGTDQQGRDLFSGIVYGVRISMIVGVVATILSMFLGTVLGLIAGYKGGWADVLNYAVC